MFKKIFKFLRAQDSFVLYPTVISFIFALLVSLAFLSSYKKLPHQIPLFYSLSWGQNQLVDLTQFMILPGLIILFTLTNLIISWHLHPSQLPLKRILNLSSMIIALLLTITAFKIIWIFI